MMLRLSDGKLVTLRDVRTVLYNLKVLLAEREAILHELYHNCLSNTPIVGDDIGYLQLSRMIDADGNAQDLVKQLVLQCVHIENGKPTIATLKVLIEVNFE